MANDYISQITLPNGIEYNIKDDDAARLDHIHGNISNTGTIGSNANYAIYTSTSGSLTASSFAMNSPSASGTAIAFITSVTQNANGSITASKSTIPTASSSVTGITLVGAAGGAAAYSHGNHVPTTQTANNITFLRNDNNWYKLTRNEVNTLINLLDTGSSDLSANDYVITQYVNGGSTTTTYHRRPASKVINAVLVKTALGATASSSNHNNQYLRKDGTWQNHVISVNNATGAITIYAPMTLGTTGQIIKSNGEEAIWQNEYNVTIEDWT